MTPHTLDELRKMSPGSDRALAIAAYIKAGEQKLRDARKLRDDDLRALAAQHGPAKAARLAKVSLSTVKLAVGRP
jgi:hypothetical protein